MTTRAIPETQPTPTDDLARLTKPTRRRFLTACGLVGGAGVVGGGSFAMWKRRGQRAYHAAVETTYRPADLSLRSRALIVGEIARYATMAPTSHNTQPWRLELDESSLILRPDPTRRCPVVDPDDHHVFVSLGCAAENAAVAATAYGLASRMTFDDATDSLRLEFSPSSAATVSPRFEAVPRRQTTRREFNGSRLTSAELDELATSAREPGVAVVMISGARDLEAVLEFVVAGNRTQMNDPAFVAELKHWVRTSAFTAVRTLDGLFTATSGNPVVPEWLGKRLFSWLYTIDSETSKYEQQLRSSAGAVAFVAETESKLGWIAVGRSFERFALQATAMGILHSHVNQPVEVPELRAEFARFLGVGDKRPDLLVRFGRGTPLPRSLRRPVTAVLDS